MIQAKDRTVDYFHKLENLQLIVGEKL